MLTEDGASNVRWLRLDASTLKQQLVTLCDNWVSAFSGLLASLASRQLSGLHDELQAHVAALTGKPAPKPAAVAGEGEDGALEGAQAAEGAEAEQVQQQQQPPEGAEQAEAVAESALPEVAELHKQQAVEALEALHGRLEGEREELAQRLAACQEQYDALVSLQVRGKGLPPAYHCPIPAACHSNI